MTKLSTDLQDLLSLLDGSLSFSNDGVEVRDPPQLRATIHRLAEVSALERGRRQGLARLLVRQAALANGVVPASIHDLYYGRGQGDVPLTFTVPAMNLRALPFEAARAVFQAARQYDAGAFIFEIARSEMGYTDQRPAEYATSVLAAAIAEDFHGPVFLQGDHFQVSAKRYASDPETELAAVRDLIREAIAAGFYNIDIDTSTLVDVSRPEIADQQALNSSLSAMFTEQIRELEPEGITISVGGEIGEVGGHNSTEPELRAYMDSFNEELLNRAPGASGLSKISIQTGTSHGGVVLPDGSIAEVAVDFDSLKRLSRTAREEYRMGGAVQHGASTLPETAFSKFVEAEAVEVHLATNFMNMLFDRLPAGLKGEMYSYLDEKYVSERKPGMTSEQFYYKTRKNAVGPFKAQTWNLPQGLKEEIRTNWMEQFSRLFQLLGMAGTREIVERTVKALTIQPDRTFYLGAAGEEVDVSDLAD